MRLGKIVIPRDFINSLTDEELIEIFKYIVPIEIKWGFHDAEFLCRSTEFDDIKEGDSIPQYVIELSSSPNGIIREILKL